MIIMKYFINPILFFDLQNDAFQKLDDNPNVEKIKHWAT